MEFPNLPEGLGKVIVIDGRINEEVIITIKSLDIKVIKTHIYDCLYEQITYHPDILMHHLGNSDIVYAPGCAEDFLNELKYEGFNLIKGEKPLSEKYPENIAYNVARVGKYAIHNVKFMDTILKEELKKRNVKFINVNQGYSKCSISVVDENSIITSDISIYKECKMYGLDVLLINNDNNIKLSGFEYGFIGGCSGLIGEKLWGISGDFNKLKEGYMIKEFLQKRNIDIISLSNGDIYDIGSIITLK